jgi:hypothetical protein
LRTTITVGVDDGAGFFIAYVEQALPPEHGVDAVLPLSGEAIADLYGPFSATRKAPSLDRTEVR